MSMTTTKQKNIHLLYAPTTFCNMGCKYCYLGEHTDSKVSDELILATLEKAVKSLKARGHNIFNLSLHGGEATTIKPSVLEKIFQYMTQHYLTLPIDNYKPVHIKTNLYNFDRLYEMFDSYKISISASIDLPLALHDKYRVTKSGESTLQKILGNLQILVGYPHSKKASCVINKEHFERTDEIIEDIKKLHYEIGFDMNNFNFMFGFESAKNAEKFGVSSDGLCMLTPEEQVVFYNKIKNAFMGTDLENAFKYRWFEEFLPGFCSQSINCGSQFFLIDGNGDVYSCPRGQSSERFKYGNIYTEDIDFILENGEKTIENIKNGFKMSNDCISCEYLAYCNNGCPFVNMERNLDKSYTCLLQKEIFKDNPDRYPPGMGNELLEYKRIFTNTVQKDKMFDDESDFSYKAHLTPEIFEKKNSLQAIIDNDHILQKLYEPNAFKILLNHEEIEIVNQPFKTSNTSYFISKEDSVRVLIKKDLFDINCQDGRSENNSLVIIAIRDTKITYGDESRDKMEHTFGTETYRNMLVNNSYDDNYYYFELLPTLTAYKDCFIDGVRNCLFFTTKNIREYHYDKHKKNAFYHIQAINLPFHVFDFLWIQVEE